MVTTPSTIAVDWSGALQGVRKKLWLAQATKRRLVRLEPVNSREELVDDLIERARRERELVVGFDFAFSFPRWFVKECGARDIEALWRIVAAQGEEWLRICPAPFWGRRHTARPRADPARSWFRHTESDRLPAHGTGPKSVFQVGGAGAVGTGSIRGMPWLLRLRTAGFAIWPFDAPRLPLVIEIYPRFLTGRVQKNDELARRFHLQHNFEGQDPKLLQRAASSEDAFDAACSALIMARHAERFESLPVDEHEIYRLEGCIWRPPDDPMRLAIARDTHRRCDPGPV